MKRNLILFASAMILTIGGVVFASSRDAAKNCPMTPGCSTPAQCQEKMSGCNFSPECCKPKN